MILNNFPSLKTSEFRIKYHLLVYSCDDDDEKDIFTRILQILQFQEYESLLALTLIQSD